jgi:hypothetical protein
MRTKILSLALTLLVECSAVTTGSRARIAAARPQAVELKFVQWTASVDLD